MATSRRDILGAGAAAGIGAFATRVNAATFGNPDEPPQGLVNAQKDPRSAVDPGPQNPRLSGQFANAFTPPATDVGDLPLFWASFNDAPRRIQDGGWARQVTQSDFQVSQSIAGVNMRLAAGAIRELHWHQAAEWAFMSYGNCRITVLDPQGRAYVADVTEGDLWYFPVGYPHSLQGLGPDGPNSPRIRRWQAVGVQYAAGDRLGRAHAARRPGGEFRRAAETFAKSSCTILIFQSSLPGPLAADQDAVKSPNGPPPNPYLLAFARTGGQADQGGMVQIPTAIFAATIAAAHIKANLITSKRRDRTLFSWRFSRPTP